MALFTVQMYDNQFIRRFRVSVTYSKAEDIAAMLQPLFLLLLSTQISEAVPIPLQAALSPAGASLVYASVPANVPKITGGGLPNSTTPVKVDAKGATALQLLQFLENLEAYFY